MIREIVECDGCAARLGGEVLTIEIIRGSVGAFKFIFRGEAVYFSPSTDGPTHFCGIDCLLIYFKRRAAASFKKWVNSRNDLKPDEIIGD